MPEKVLISNERQPGSSGASQAMGAVVSDPAAPAVRGTPRVAHAGATHNPPRHRGVSAQASWPRPRTAGA